MSSKLIYTLCKYNVWANQKLLEAISRLPASVIQETRAAAFGGILPALSHINIIDRVWSAHLLNIDHGYKSRTPESLESLELLSQQIREIGNWYVGYCCSLPIKLFAEEVSFDFIDGGSGSMSRESILMHVCNHKSFHRGHICDMFYQSGYNPPVLDLPVYFRDSVDSYRQQ